MCIKYYNQNAYHFYKQTLHLDMSAIRSKFLSYLNGNSKILDAGCGSGRDALAFKEMGFEVEAFDASNELARLATNLTGLNVEVKQFVELDKKCYYDTIWCCASLIHVPFKELPKTMSILSESLKYNGIWYISFKYGSNERYKGERFFTDLDEVLLDNLLKLLDNINLKMLWFTDDIRPNKTRKWLNAILQKSKTCKFT